MTTSADTGGRLFASERRRLFGIAYRMLGTATEAEDAVSEAFVRWSAAEQGAIAEPAAWLTTVLSRICLDRLRSAQRTRETYVGPWLPEPVATSAFDPADVASAGDTLSLAFLVVLEALSPLERATFLLHDVFGYRHDEVAAMLDRTPAAVRQAASRARRHLEDRRPRFADDADRHREVTEAFVAAAAGGDMQALMALLAPDVEFASDGGGVVTAVRHPQRGRERVAMVITQLATSASEGITVTPLDVNGRVGLAVGRNDVDGIDSVWLLHAVDGRITRVHAIRNPAKLTALRQ